MSESDDSSGASRVDNSLIGVYRAELNRTNRELMELNKERIRFLSDKTKNEDQIKALNELITELKAEKNDIKTKIVELFAPAPAGSFFFVSVYEIIAILWTLPHIDCSSALSFCPAPGARHKRTFDEVAQTASPATPPVLPSNYKSDAAAYQVRAFFSYVAKWFLKKGLVERPKNGFEPTMGNILNASFSSKAVSEVFTEEEWEYLSFLNDWVNSQVHKAILARWGGGFVTMVCPTAALDVDCLKSVAVKTGIVDDAQKFIVKPDNVVSPPLPQLSLPKAGSK
jgi:hypothetical protein